MDGLRMADGLGEGMKPAALPPGILEPFKKVMWCDGDAFKLLVPTYQQNENNGGPSAPLTGIKGSERINSCSTEL